MQALLGASPRPTTNCARSVRNGALNGRSSSGQGPEDRKDNDMIAVALVIAWFAVVGLVLIARGDYRQRRPIR
jgi:hypothetical protein